MKTLYITLSVLFFSIVNLQAQTWNGSVSNVWTNPLNWTPNTVPNSSSNITLNGAGLSPQLQGNTSVGAITSASGATLDFNGFSLSVGGINAYTNILGATLINTNASTDIVLNINTGSAGYNSQMNGCTVNDHITINISGNNDFYEGVTASTTFNGNVIFNVNGSAATYICNSMASQYNGNFNYTRTVAGSSYIFNTGVNVTGNVNIQNPVGGYLGIGHGSVASNINGMLTINVSYPSVNSFIMTQVKNQMSGGTVNVQNSLGFVVNDDSLKVTSLTIQGYEGNAYAYLRNNLIEGNVIIEDDLGFSSGYHTEVRNNTIIGNSSFTVKGSNTFFEAYTAAQPNVFTGNTTFNLNGSGTLYACHSAASTFNGNLIINRTVAGYVRLFNAGATINGNFTFNNTASGDNDLGALANKTAISGTINMNINLSPIGRFEMYRLVNQTSGGKINARHTKGFDLRSDSLKVDSLNVIGYRGNAYGYFVANQVIGHVTIADSTGYAGGYNTQLSNSTITGNTNLIIYGSNELYEGITTANTFNGNLSINAFGSGAIYTSHQAKSTISGNFSVNRTGAGYTRLFTNGAIIGGNFSYTKSVSGASDLGLLTNKTTIAGTINMNITQTNSDAFSMHRVINATNGGTIVVNTTKGFNLQQDSILVTSFSIMGYGGSDYGSFHTSQITGNVTLQDIAGYGSGYGTYMRNNIINGNCSFTTLGSNNFYEADVASAANTFNGNVIFNGNGTGGLYTSHGSKSTFNGNLTINRTIAGYTRAFNAGATITGNFAFTKNAAGASDFGNLSNKTLISGTINMNVTQTTSDEFSLYRIQNLTNGGSISINNPRGFDVQRDSLLTNTFSILGYSGSQYGSFHYNQITGNLSLQDLASYSGGYATYLRYNIINGNCSFTTLGSNHFYEADVPSAANTFNGNVIFNGNGTGGLYTSHGSQSTFNGNLTINRTIAGFTRAFNAGATITGNFAFTKNAAGASDFGNLANKTLISGTINLNVIQTTTDDFSIHRLQNLTNGGSILIQNTEAPSIQQDSFLVNSMSVSGYGGGAYAYLSNNQIIGDLTYDNSAAFGGGYSTYIRNNTITGNCLFTNNSPNVFNDADVANSGNTYLGNVTYTRVGGTMNIGTVDTNSYAGNLVFNNTTALPITAELIKFIGSNNTNIDQLGTGPVIIQKPIVNKSSAARVTLNKPVRVTSACTFVSGYINSSSTNPLTFLDNITHTGASDNSHVVGCVTKVGNDIFTFPVGNGIGYHPMAITAPAAATDTFQSCIILNHPSVDGYDVTSKDAALLQIAPYHYWTLNQISGTNSETVSLGWSIPCANTVVANLPGMAVARWNGTQWNNLGNSATSGTLALGTVTQTGTTANYGVFALATTSALNSWQITSVTASASTVCAGTSTTLTGAGAATYNWQPGNLTGTSVVVTPLTTTTFTVTGTSSTGCITTATKTIIVNPLPTPNAGPDKVNNCITPSQTIGTAGVAGVTYAWLPSTGLSAANIAQPVANPAATTTYTITATITATGCTATDAVLVTVDKTPPTANAGLDKINNCITPSNTIGTATVVGNTYAWSPATGLSSTTIAQPIANPASTTTYSVTVTKTSNGCTATDAVLVTVDKTPPTANAGLDKINNCTTPSNTIGTATIAGNTYAWSPAAGLSSTTIAQPIANPAATTTYSVTVTKTSNGCTATDAVLVTVDKIPPTANAGIDQTNTCTTPSNTIGTTTVAGNTYAWSPATGLSSTSIAQPIANPASTTTYTVTVTKTSNGCTATDAVLVTVNKTAPSANAGADKTNTCSSPSSVIGTASVVGNTYAWSPTTGLSSSSVAQPTANPTSTTTYTVTVTNTANGCTAADAVLVNVNKTAPTVGTTASATSICLGASTTLTGTGANTYTWQPGALSGTSVIVSPTSTTTYTVTGTSTSNGCTATSTRTITVNICSTTLNLKLFLQGFYTGPSTMAPVLLNQGMSASSTVTDTVLVQLRNTTAPYAIVATTKAVVNTSGNAVCTFTPSVSGTYYIAVHHRNSTQTWSGTGISFAAPTVTYDFSNAITKAYGSNMALLSSSPNVYGFFAGDINQDENVDLLDFSILDNAITNFLSGYEVSDVNGDGNVDLLDIPVVENNANNFIFSSHP